MPNTIPSSPRTYSTPEAAELLGVSKGLLYKIGRAGEKRPEYRQLGCIRIGTSTRWAASKIDAAAPERNAA